MGQNTLYAIGIGGTGAKCLEAIAQLASVGLLTESEAKFLFVDADETNGNLERARATFNIYRRTHELVTAQGATIPWLQTPIKSYIPDVWSPFGNTSINKNLGSFFSYNNLQEGGHGLGDLFNVLYTDKERDANLDVGFRGRPAIGAAVMSNLNLDNLDEEPWARLTQDIFSDVGNSDSPRIFLCGSIFGGTGASGLPTLGRLIYNKLTQQGIKGAKIACLFVLPYFRFSPPIGKAAGDEVHARSEQFLLNTEAALRYYNNQNEYFDTVYLLGNQNLSNYNFSIGKNTQKNEPHFIELYSALAARHFLTYTPPGKNAVVLNSRQSTKGINWSDLPDPVETKTKLVDATRFAYAWLSNIAPELKKAKKKGVASFSKSATWFLNFYRPQQGGLGRLLNKKGEDYPDFNDPTEQQNIVEITAWSEDYIRWLLGLHQSDVDPVQLFQTNALSDRKDLGEKLCDLVNGDSRDKNTKRQDTIDNLHLELEAFESSEKGTVGLAKALYTVCHL